MAFDIHSWIAGIWEGEGSIDNSIRYKTKNIDKRYLRIIFYNNDLSMLLKVKEFFPEGKIFLRKYGKIQPNSKPSFVLTLNKKEAITRFILEIAPLVQSEYRKKQLKRYINVG